MTTGSVRTSVPVCMYANPNTVMQSDSWAHGTAHSKGVGFGSTLPGCPAHASAHTHTFKVDSRSADELWSSFCVSWFVHSMIYTRLHRREGGGCGDYSRLMAMACLLPMMSRIGASTSSVGMIESTNGDETMAKAAKCARVQFSRFGATTHPCVFVGQPSRPTCQHLRRLSSVKSLVERPRTQRGVRS